MKSKIYIYLSLIFLIITVILVILSVINKFYAGVFFIPLFSIILIGIFLHLWMTNNGYNNSFKSSKWKR